MKKLAIVIIHTGYWAIYAFLLFILLLFIQEGSGGHPYQNTGFMIFFGVFTVVPGFISFYSFYTILFTRLLNRKRILLFSLAAPITAIVSALVAGLILSLVMGSNVMFADGWQSFYEETVFMAVIALIHGIVGLVVRGFITWYGDIRLKEELNRKNYEMELALVKSQINPHFLFNTLNNIDVMIEKDAPRASGYLNELSDIMRFMLYETKTEKIPLDKELEYIRKYIDLQKIRTSNVSYVNYSVEGESSHLTVAPMLFIPFIENAFKHAEKKKENAITIRFILGKDKIIFECENNYNIQDTHRDDAQGLGNDLIHKRLQLLYPKKHTLDIRNDNGIYSVKLFIYGHEN